MTFLRKTLPAAILLLIMTWAGQALAIHGTNAPGFFPAFFNTFNYAGTVSLLLKGTSVPTDGMLLPGTVPGGATGFKVDLSVRRESLKMFLRGDFYYDGWSGMNVPLMMLDVHHQILKLRFGDLYGNLDPLLLANRAIRGGGMITSFEILDDLLRLDVQFQVGRSREGSDIGSAVPGLYGVEDSLGTYPTNMGLMRINLAEGEYNLYNVAFNFLHTEDYTKDAKVDSTLFPPRRSRLYGIEFNYAFPGGIADLQSRYYLSSLRENTNDGDETDDAQDHAIVLDGDGTFGKYGYRARYQYVGKDYFTGGNPYLRTDRHGFRLGGVYTQAGLVQVTGDGGYYRTNLDHHPRTPTGNVLDGRVRASLEKDKWPRLYLQLRLKGAWSDSVLVEVMDAGQQAFPEQFRREQSTTFGADLGGDATLGKVWLSGWTGYMMYRDGSHHIVPVLLKPADSDQWLLGLRTRWRVLPSFRLDNGLTVALVRQEQADLGAGIDETMMRLYARGEYRPPAPLKDTKVRATLEYTRRASTLAERDYAVFSFDLAPRYHYRDFLAFELGYGLTYATGRRVDYTAHTFSLETVVLY